MRRLILFAGALSACAAGSGPLVTYSDTGRDDPGMARDPPPGTRDSPGGVCIECDVSYDCSGPSAALQFGGGQLELSTSGGTCVQALIDLVCSGALFGASGCNGGGGGPFTCGDTTCSPSSTQFVTGTVMPSPPSGGTMGSSSGVVSGFGPDAG